MAGTAIIVYLRQQRPPDQALANKIPQIRSEKCEHNTHEGLLMCTETMQAAFVLTFNIPLNLVLMEMASYGFMI